jgi:hypothetical protein
MAGIKATDLANVLNTIPISTYFQAFRRSTTFIDAVGGLTPGPARIQIPVHHAGNTTAASYAESADLHAAGHQSRTMVTQSYKRCYVTCGVDGLQEAIAKRGGVVNIQDLVMSEINEGIADLLDEINTQALGDGTGNSAADIDGILYHIDDNNTWCSVSRSGASYLQSYMSGNAGTDRALTETLLRTVGNTLKDTHKSNYNKLFTSHTMHDAYQDLMGDKRRYVPEMVNDVQVQRLAFDGRPIVPIDGYTANRFDFVDTSLFNFWYLPQVQLDQWHRKIEGPFKVEPYYGGTDDTVFIIMIYLNLVCKNPWKCGALDDVE